MRIPRLFIALLLGALIGTQASNALAQCGHCDQHGSDHHDKPSMHRASDSGSPEFIKAANGLLNAYLDLQESLANDDLSGAKRKIWEIEKAADALRNGESIEGWAKIDADLRSALKRAKKDASLDALRVSFEGFSNAAREIQRNWGGSLSVETNLAYCPMALKGKGAHWLQRGDEVANPYFGKMMLRCGEIRPSSNAK